MNSIKLYRQLEAKGYDIGMLPFISYNGLLLNPLCVPLGLKQCGSLNLAQTKDRMIALKRRIAYNSPTGLHCEVNTFLI